MVDNKPGAGGTVATREAAAAGHRRRLHLPVANVGVLAVIPYATKDAGYDPRADIAPVCLAVEFPNVLVTHPAVPANTLAEYLALARRPVGMDDGTAGVGTAGHLAGELLKARSGAKLNHVPFRGGGPAMNDPGGRPCAVRVCQRSHRHRRHARGGRIRALAVTSAKRSPFDPNIPTVAEQGFAGYAANPTGMAVVVSSKVPTEIVANAERGDPEQGARRARGADGVGRAGPGPPGRRG